VRYTGSLFVVGVGQYGPFKVKDGPNKGETEKNEDGTDRVLPFVQFADPDGHGLFVAVAGEGVGDLPAPNAPAAVVVEVVPDDSTGGKRAKYRYLGLAERAAKAA